MRNTTGFVQGYITCALWSTNDNSDPETGGEPLDANYGPDDIAPETMVEITADCAAFMFANREALRVYLNERGVSPDYAGHDFWLTRNGHGTGFWDRTYTPGAFRDACMALTDASKVYGEFDLYVGDDGRIYS